MLFTTAAAMIATLTRVLGEGRLEEKLKLYTVPRLLIIDEIGYLPIDRAGANLFFQLISRRYEKGPMILTSNQSFGAWGEVFGDRIIATAILDRVLHHAITLNIRGNSYRLKEKLKAGLVRAEGCPGYLRIDSVHQGDEGGIKGVYHINAVDCVTQWEAVATCERLSEAYLLPVIQALLDDFPFTIRGFHADNGSESIHHPVARLCPMPAPSSNPASPWLDSRPRPHG